ADPCAANDVTSVVVSGTKSKYCASSPPDASTNSVKITANVWPHSGHLRRETPKCDRSTRQWVLRRRVVQNASAVRASSPEQRTQPNSVIGRSSHGREFAPGWV